MSRAIIVIGSNYNDSFRSVESTFDWLAKSFQIVGWSGIYQTPDYLGSGCGYHNAVIELEHEGSVESLNALFKQYESEFGRSDALRGLGKVPIDIDIIIADGKVLRQKDYDTKYFKTGYDLLKKNLETHS